MSAKIFELERKQAIEKGILRIKTNRVMLRNIIKHSQELGCSKCGKKLLGVANFFVEQIPSEGVYILKYKILCDNCGRAEG